MTHRRPATTHRPWRLAFLVRAGIPPARAIPPPEFAP